MTAPRADEDVATTLVKQVLFLVLFWTVVGFAVLGVVTALLLLHYAFLDHLRIAIWWQP